MEWAELIEFNQRKLGYLSSKLEIKNRGVKEKFESEYATIINEKVSARLTKTKADKITIETLWESGRT